MEHKRLDQAALAQNLAGTGSRTTLDFDEALVDASRLLAHAASTGLLSKGTPHCTQALIADVVHAQEAAWAGRLTPEMVVSFWFAYGRLAHLVRPVTAASLVACRKISLTGMKLLATVLVAAIILFSIYLFMSTATLNDTSDLIDQQNIAALKLWSDVQMLRNSGGEVASGNKGAATNGADAVIAERVFEETVEFSRKNAWLLQSASRLNYWFTPWWMVLSNANVVFNEKHSKEAPDHLNVPAQISTVAEIETEAVNQITAYQNIRDYALGLYKIDSLIYSSLSAYFLPTVYALLGAFLYGFRLYSRLIRRREFLPSVAYSARYYIAAMAGLVVGLFGTLLPKSLAMPPLAVAFLVGYAVEAFFSRLDDLIRRFKTDKVGAAVPQQAEAGAVAAE